MSLFEIPVEEPEDESIPDDRIRESFDDHKEFVDYLDTHYHSITSDDLHIVLGVTGRNENDILENLSRLGWITKSERGVIYRLHKPGEDNDDYVGTYFHFDSEDGILKFYSNVAKTKGLDEITQDVQNLNNTSKLYLRPWQLKELAIRLKDDPRENLYASRIIAKRSGSSEIDCERDPHFKRTINYFGNDSLRVVEELTDVYGVLPNIIDFHFPDGTQFSVDTNGVFKLMSGTVSTVFEEVDSVIQETVKVKDAYVETTTKEIELPGQEKIISQATPAIISPGRHNKFSEEAIRSLFDEVFPENGHSLINPFIDEDGSYYYSNVYDTKNGIQYDIRGDKKQMRIFPRAKERELSTFMDVFELVQRIADAQAEAETSTIDVEVDSE